ncbi:MAG: DUF3341 domain-containing protein [candidate division Zixibacteria bacterium]|nr:DUF3341 domain-containing protein [candidate division Zixibacteria bacterium]
MAGTGIFGLLAEFQTVPQLMAAAEKVRDAGYTHWDSHTPFPVHGLSDAMGLKPTRLPYVVLAGGLTGGTVGLAMQWWMNAIDYPLIISGKPLFSIPANIPVMFELTVLCAAIGAFLGMLVMNGLPALYHPLLTNDRFRRATADRFFISIEADDPKFDAERTAGFLRSLGSSAVEEVRG